MFTPETAIILQIFSDENCLRVIDYLRNDEKFKSYKQILNSYTESTASLNRTLRRLLSANLLYKVPDKNKKPQYQITDNTKHLVKYIHEFIKFT